MITDFIPVGRKSWEHFKDHLNSHLLLSALRNPLRVSLFHSSWNLIVFVFSPWLISYIQGARLAFLVTINFPNGDPPRTHQACCTLGFLPWLFTSTPFLPTSDLKCPLLEEACPPLTYGNCNPFSPPNTYFSLLLCFIVPCRIFNFLQIVINV